MTICERILERAAKLSEGQAISAKQLLQLGSRAAVDQGLSRLVRRGKLMRAARGFYVRPVESRFGVRAPSPEKVAASIAAARGETIATPGAVEANRLGLTTQVPLRSTFLTSGRTRSIGSEQRTVELRHAPAWQFAVPGRAGAIVRALAWAGRERIGEVLSVLRRKVPAAEMAIVARHVPQLPSWMAQHLVGA